MKAMNIIREPRLEIRQVERLINGFEELANQIVPYSEEEKKEGEKDTGELPNYCSYFHAQFWGKKFP